MPAHGSTTFPASGSSLDRPQQCSAKEAQFLLLSGLATPGAVSADHREKAKGACNGPTHESASDKRHRGRAGGHFTCDLKPNPVERHQGHDDNDWPSQNSLIGHGRSLEIESARSFSGRLFRRCHAFLEGLLGIEPSQQASAPSHFTGRRPALSVGCGRFVRCRVTPRQCDHEDEDRESARHSSHAVPRCEGWRMLFDARHTAIKRHPTFPARTGRTGPSRTTRAARVRRS